MISAIMTIYNGETYLEEALDSILNQQNCKLEIIAVNDGSTDRTAKILHSYSDKIRIIEQSNLGPSAGRNRGIQEARGEHLAFLDADDIWPPEKLHAQLAFLQQNPHYSVVMGPLMRMYMLPQLTFSQPERAGSVCCALFRKSIFEQVGLFNPKLRFGEDLEWLIRAREQQVPIAVLPQVALFYRIHANNLTQGKSLREMRFLSVLGQSLQRRRTHSDEKAASLTPLIYQEMP